MTHGSLALKLRVLRAEKALTIEQAAARAGVTPETISDAERGRRHPYLPTLRKLAAAYDVPVEELLAEEEPEAALAGSSPKAEARSSGRPEAPPAGVAGPRWASDEEYEAALYMVRKMYRKRSQQIQGLTSARPWEHKPPPSEHECRNLMTDVLAAYTVLNDVGVSEELRPVGFWMREAMILAFLRLVDTLRNILDAALEAEGAGEADTPVMSIEEARERLRGAA
jgi:transcriptional regulator with XRE-family HTH domain